ncbi:hypothetical protein SAMN02745157_0285 [Kaistia soli DSM 19436]|uniref:Uncharacterized protein n=1 Tax=Kaistia soli DSM 19436 TaxID=1122133 RepID=A0A1M5Q1X6_9HYPH|nr:hypothetical protein [Kaistia soli]SHH07739.1 hypothetical protein SAMN02745157_0285 [Kaistia soli DSM 19436]
MVDWFKVMILVAEANEVIWLRSMKLLRGGPRAKAEARMMVAEKVVAAEDAGAGLLAGESLDNVVAGYSRQVQSNARRLRRS